MTTGADWSQQLFAACTALAFGIAAALPLMLLNVKTQGFEKVLADFFAVVLSTALFLLSVQFGAKGQPTVYGAVCFLAGAAAGRKLAAKAVEAIKRRRTAARSSDTPDTADAPAPLFARLLRKKKKSPEKGND